MHEYGSDTLTEISYLILLAFCRPNHGYGVLQFLIRHTDGRVRPGAGTLYGAINSLESKGWIDLTAKENRKNIYLITDSGKQMLEKEVQRLKQNYILGEEIMKGLDK